MARAGPPRCRSSATTATASRSTPAPAPTRRSRRSEEGSAVTTSDRSPPEPRPDAPVGQASPDGAPEGDRSPPPPPLEPARRLRSRTWWLVATGRLVMFAGAAAAAAYAMARPAGREVRAEADRYRCPMHPDVDS